jgi:hypothetical protein
VETELTDTLDCALALLTLVLIALGGVDWTGDVAVLGGERVELI